MGSSVSGLKPKIIFFRDYKKFENYLFLTNSFSKIVEKHVSLKKKNLSGNHAHFVSKELSKAIYTRSKFRNRFLKNADEINSKLYKQQ